VRSGGTKRIATQEEKCEEQQREEYCEKHNVKGAM
jgi:hypothetical protein